MLAENICRNWELNKNVEVYEKDAKTDNQRPTATVENADNQQLRVVQERELIRFGSEVYVSGSAGSWRLYQRDCTDNTLTLCTCMKSNKLTLDQ